MPRVCRNASFSFGKNRIKELRLAKGHTSLREFVRYINKSLGFRVSLGTIYLLEQHKNENPSWKVIAVLSQYFGVSADYLMGRSNTTSIEGTEHPLLDGLTLEEGESLIRSLAKIRMHRVLP